MEPVPPRVEEPATAESKPLFNEDLIFKYPKSQKKMKIDVQPYKLNFLQKEIDPDKVQTTFLSPYGIEFQGQGQYQEGMLLKIDIVIPNYWKRKRQFVNYSRIDVPASFGVLVKVLRYEEIGKRGKKKKVVTQVVNIDETDEMVLKGFLEEA
jgi:hypothetical protein